jgi:hypothetical protein
MFEDFVKDYKGENTPMGDLVFDIERDKNFPWNSSVEEQISYLSLKAPEDVVVQLKLILGIEDDED